MTPITSKHRVETALRGGKPDRVPFNFWMDRRLLKQYEQEYGYYFRVEHYGGDVIESYQNIVWPSGKTIVRDGTEWVIQPLWPNDWRGLKGFEWPDPEAAQNFEMLACDLNNKPDKAIFVNVQGIMGVMHCIRSENDLYTDFFERPDDVLELFQRIAELLARFVTIVCDRYPDITAIYLQDDICSSQGVMFSPDILDRFVYFANDLIVNAALAAGKPVVYHSDGNILNIVEHLISIGVCAINPLQPNVNNPHEFIRRFGGRISVYGGLDNCFVIPDATPQDVREHVLYTFDTLGKDGGLILSSHDIGPHCPRENIEALVHTIHEECTY